MSAIQPTATSQTQLSQTRSEPARPQVTFPSFSALCKGSCLQEKAQPLPRPSAGQRLAPWIAGAVGLAACAYGILFYGKKPDVPLSPKATEIKNAAEIATMTHLGGVPIEPFQAQASEIGLLGQGDNLKDLLTQDWSTVEKFGTTHIAFAKALKQIRDAALAGTTKLEFDPNSLESRIGMLLPIEWLELEYKSSACANNDPFAKFVKTWKVPSCGNTLKISNPKTGDKLEIKDGMIELIEQFGFYGNSTSRIDPLQTAAVLSGKNPAVLQKQFSEENLILAKRSVVQAIGNFANKLNERLVKQEGANKSFAHSSVSLIATLGMALNMIKPEKKQEFLHTIGLGSLTEQEANQAIGEVLKEMALPKDFTKGKMEVAQAFARKNWVEVKDSLPRYLKDIYQAEVFADDNLMDAVNRWASDKTHGLIQKILSSNDSNLVLLNAIYLASAADFI